MSFIRTQLQIENYSCFGHCAIASYLSFLIVVMETNTARLPCAVFRDELKRLASYAASGYVPDIYASLLRKKILDGAFDADADKLKDVLSVIEMHSASELTAVESVHQLRMSGCFADADVDESLFEQMPATSRPQITLESESGTLHVSNVNVAKRIEIQTQLDDAGFVRSKAVRLMSGQASFSNMQAPQLLSANSSTLKRFLCPKCSNYFATSQALGAHLATKHPEKQASRHTSLLRFLQPAQLPRKHVQVYSLVQLLPLPLPSTQSHDSFKLLLYQNIGRTNTRRRS